MKTITLLAIFILFSIDSFNQTKIISGNFEPQTQPLSCWAASLSNISRPIWNRKKIPELSFFNNYPHDIPNLDTFSRLAKLEYNFRMVRRDSVLKWSSVERNFSYRFSRPMIYSFKVEGRSDYHLVNIIGYEKNSLADERFNRWMYVFDPKPDNKGNHYLKNFLTYQLIDNDADSSQLQGTSYQFVSKNISLPQPMPDVAEKGILNRLFDKCTPLDSISLKIQSIFENISPEIQRKIGLKIEGLKIIDKPMDVDLFQNTVVNKATAMSIKSDTASFQVVLQNNSSSKIIPFVTTENRRLSFHTSVVIREMRNSCWVIERIEKIDFLNALSSINTEWTLTNATPFAEISPDVYYKIIYDKNNNRFVQFEKQGKSQFYDVDGFLDKGKTTIYTKDEFYKKLFKIDKPILKPNMQIKEVYLPANWDNQFLKKYSINKVEFDKFKKINPTKILMPVLKN